MTIGIVEYGAGNLASVRKGLAAAGADILNVHRPEDLDGVHGIVVPGVGHFGATASLDDQWKTAVRRRIDAGVPLFGICLGMQWLFDGSDEAPEVSGSGLLAGRCSRIVAERPLKVPHVGWNSLALTTASSILAGIDGGTYVYFTHAYAAPVTMECAATSVHGIRFAAAVQRDHVAGVQFHPERSGDAGVSILRNFVRLTRS